MKGLELINALKKKLGAVTDSELAQCLGNSIPAIQNWKKRQAVTVRQVAGLVHSSRRASDTTLQRDAIRPIVEFFPIEKYSARGAPTRTLFTSKSADGAKHPYLDGLRKELENHSGVYVFFDSRGQAIYAGKARRQSLWTEINLAFKRNRGAAQSIKRVAHPSRKQVYKTSNETARLTCPLQPYHR